MTEEPTTPEKSRKRDWVFLVLGIVLVLLPMIWFPTSSPPEADEVLTEAPPAPEQEQTPAEPETDRAPTDETIPTDTR